MNAYIENLNCWESLQQKLQKLQVENEHTPLNYLQPQSKNYRNYRVKTNEYIEYLNYWESLQQKLQNLQAENEHTP